MMDKKITIVGSYNVGIFLKSDNDIKSPYEYLISDAVFI